jgi:predicted GH43/DUF377 family glycosyl hydrolase
MTRAWPALLTLLALAAQAGGAESPSVFRHGDAWYMMYIIFDGSGYETAIAESRDLLSWKPLGKVLRFRDGTWDATYAHKPWVIRHKGVVYHFYCAVGNQGRVIALATSRKIR